MAAPGGSAGAADLPGPAPGAPQAEVAAAVVAAAAAGSAGEDGAGRGEGAPAGAGAVAPPPPVSDGGRGGQARIGPYTLGRTLGTGSTCKVKRAVNEATGEVVAIKIISKELLRKKPSLRRKIQREIAVMKMMRSHPNVIDFYELYETDGHLLLVVEYCPHGELFDRLITRGCFPPDEALDIFQQVIHGLKYCHKRLICHRDIKPENLLLAPGNVVKLVDFGLATMAVGNLLETACGSAHYASPEIISGESYDGYLSDVWSCGVLLFALLTGSLPFDDDNFSRLLAKVQAAKLTLPPSIPTEVRSLLLGMLTADPRARFSLEDVMAHPWFLSRPPRLVDSYDVPDPFMSAESAANSVPVLNPNPVYLGHLRALGWGETSVLKRKLAATEHSLERECYRTFERHYEQQEDKRRVGRDVSALESQLSNVALANSGAAPA